MYLYHYTSLAAFQSIVEHERLRLTNVQFMNDFMEVRWLLKLAQLIIGERVETQPIQSSIELLASYGNTAGWLNQETLEHVYCVCFSRKGDDLAQWRSYADEGHGVAVGFDVDDLLRANPKEHTEGNLQRQPVVYDEQEQAAIARHIILEEESKALGLGIPPPGASPHSEMTPEERSLAANRAFARSASLHSRLVAAGARCKAPAFKLEEEERIVYARATPVIDTPSIHHKLTEPRSYLGGFPLRWRSRRGCLVPFIEIIAPKKSIHKVVLGPCFDRDNSAFLALDMFLRDQGIKHLLRQGTLIRSAATYRSLT